MQIIKRDLKNGEMSLRITDSEDLWHLSHVIDEGDLIRGSTERKIKIGDGENVKTVRKYVYLALNAEKIEYEPENNSLRILGPIKEGPDDVSLGSYHSFNLQEKDIVTIKKNRWSRHQLERLEDAEKPKVTSLVVLFDREDAILSILTRKGWWKVAELKGDVQKKAEDASKKIDFYEQIVQKIKEINERNNLNNIIIASPAFWKDYLLNELPENLKKKVVTTTISDVNESALTELVKRPELKQALENQRTAREMNEIENLLKAIREEKAFYGFDDAKEKISLGSAELVIVSETFLKEMKQKDKYAEIDYLLRMAEDMNAKITILTDKEMMKKLDSLGGIAGIMRWKTN